MRDATIIISELELDGETAIKIASCIKKQEPEIWKELSKALKKALPISDVVGQREQLLCPDCKSKTRMQNGFIWCENNDCGGIYRAK